MAADRPRGNGEPIRWRDIERLEYQVEELGRVKANAGEVEKVGEDLSETKALLQTVLVELATLRTKIGLWSALGALAGGGIVSLLVALATGPG